MNCLVQLDLSAFKPTTLLSKWWPVVARLFTDLQDAHNALDNRLTDESEARKADKNELLRLQGEETAQRKLSDSALEEKLMSKISDEAQLRINADDKLLESIRATDDELSQSIQTAKAELLSGISIEAEARISADAKHDSEITALKSKSHTHANAEVLGDITADDVDRWTRSAESKLENTEFLGYLDEVCADISRKIGELYTVSGMEVYDGGLYNEAYNGASLDGGDIEDTERTVVDFGDFDNRFTMQSLTLDGGQYA